MHLFIYKSEFATKYFDYCIKMRPMNAYLNYQYSQYLLQIKKDYKKSFFHLKLSKKLNPNMLILTQNYKHTKKILCHKLGGKLRCNNNQCNKILTTARTCHACKSVYYCSRKCQKQQWSKHKKQCIYLCTKPFNTKQSSFIRQIQSLSEKFYESLKSGHQLF